MGVQREGFNPVQGMGIDVGGGEATTSLMGRTQPPTHRLLCGASGVHEPRAPARGYLWGVRRHMEPRLDHWCVCGVVSCGVVPACVRESACVRI